MIVEICYSKRENVRRILKQRSAEVPDVRKAANARRDSWRHTDRKSERRQDCKKRKRCREKDRYDGR